MNKINTPLDLRSLKITNSFWKKDIANYFGEEEGKCKGYPGHEIAEMALVRLYEVTGETVVLMSKVSK